MGRASKKTNICTKFETGIMGFISFLIAWEAQCDTSFPPQPLCASMFYTSGSQPGVHDLLGGVHDLQMPYFTNNFLFGGTPMPKG